MAKRRAAVRDVQQAALATCRASAAMAKRVLGRVTRRSRRCVQR